MGEENKVILLGAWVSPFSKRVELALKFKGITFEYVEEDFQNKSPQLLQYNPVHKKIPVLVHNGKPIAESLVILEYIDETWTKIPHLLPQDPYTRAKVRFWTSFVHEQLFNTMSIVVKTDGEAQEKAAKELFKKLELLEEGIKELYPDGNPCIDSDNIGLLDLVMASLFGAHKIQEEVLGKKIIDPEKTPLIFSRLTAINQLPVVIESTPPQDKLMAVLKFYRENALKSSSTYPFAKIVELALTFKGVAFEYVEEDLRNKSPQLLNYNPVHKKVPVLVHKGKPIVESLIIEEYIDETWKNSPQFLPEDPYKRTKVRFWCSFVQQQIFGSISTVLKTDGEAQEKAINEVSEKLLHLELKEFYPDGSSAMESENVGLLDLVCCLMLGPDNVQEVLGVKILDSEKTPLICSWITAIRKLPIVKELTTPHDKLVAFLKFIRRNALKSTSA